MARPRSAAARLDRGADAEHRIRRRRNRTLPGRQALRAGAGALHGRDAARPPTILAGLCSRRAPRLAARHTCRLELPASADLARLAVLVRRGLCGAVARLSVAAGEPRLRRRVREISEAQSGAL